MSSGLRITELKAPPNNYKIFLGTSVIESDGFVLVYGLQEPSHDLFAARWPLSEATNGDLTGLQWYCGDNTFADDCQPKPVIASGAPEFSVHQAFGSYLYTETVGFGGADLAVRWAEQPLGPWHAPKVVFHPPENDWADAFIYAGKAHSELSGADVVATYVANSFKFGTVIENLDYYFPRFVRLTAE